MKFRILQDHCCHQLIVHINCSKFIFFRDLYSLCRPTVRSRGGHLIYKYIRSLRTVFQVLKLQLTWQMHSVLQNHQHCAEGNNNDLTMPNVQVEIKLLYCRLV